MGWIRRDDLHTCNKPRYVEGDEPRRSGELWACDVCHTVFELQVGEEIKYVNAVNISSKPMYWWMRTQLVYVPTAEGV